MELQELAAKVKDAYSRADYQSLVEDSVHIVFANRFSRHYVFILERVSDLTDQWRSLHDTVVEEYLDFRGDSFIEWNFYCVFIVNVEDVSSHERAEIQKIEQDRSYTRKHVRLLSEIKHLPPGQPATSTGEVNAGPLADLTKVWEEALGKKLYGTIANSLKTGVEKDIDEYLGVEGE